jgi:hypothetical protein
MKIFMTGGSGFIGTKLASAFAGRGDDVVILSRRPPRSSLRHPGISWVKGNPIRPGSWQDEAAGADAVINLAGASIFAWWTPRTKQKIERSRLAATANVVAALSRSKSRPSILVSASAVGYYGFHGEEELDEAAGSGDDFLAKVTIGWERAALEAASFGHRVVTTRFGLVLGKKGGILGLLAPLYKLGLGGPIGSGRQWFSWIHRDDLAAAVLFLLDRSDISGPVNLCAPYPVRNRELSEALGRVLRRRLFPRVPALPIRLLLGEFGTLALSGQKVIPRRLLQSGFVFRHPKIDDALADLFLEKNRGSVQRPAGGSKKIPENPASGESG